MVWRLRRFGFGMGWWVGVLASAGCSADLDHQPPRTDRTSASQHAAAPAGQDAKERAYYLVLQPQALVVTPLPEDVTISLECCDWDVDWL